MSHVKAIGWGLVATAFGVFVIFRVLPASARKVITGA